MLINATRAKFFVTKACKHRGAPHPYMHNVQGVRTDLEDDFWKVLSKYKEEGNGGGGGGGGCLDFVPTYIHMEICISPSIGDIPLLQNIQSC